METKTMADNRSSIKINSIFRILVISLLNERPMSGYEIAKSVEEKTGSKPSHGKIYPFLHDLLACGFIDELSIVPNEPHLKITYQLTECGKNELNHIFQQLELLFENFLETCENCDCRVYREIKENINLGI